MPNLPVCLVGNGGGYAYGHMGPTHHALEDCAAMNALGVRVLVPAFEDDIPILLADVASPMYLRLGKDCRPAGAKTPTYAPWRQVLSGERGALAALGPLAGVAWDALQKMPAHDRPAVWAVTEFAHDEVPAQFLTQVEGKELYIAEEHVVVGGLAMHLALLMARLGIRASKLVHRYAIGYPNGRYGSQAFHRAQCGLDAAGLLAMVSCR